MSWWDDKAWDLQAGVRSDELKMLNEGQKDYDDRMVRMSVVHAREDLVLLVSHISSLNAQLSRLRMLIWAMFFLLIWVAIK